MIRILSVEQIRDADCYTIAHEPVKSIDLMERAAEKFFGEGNYDFIAGKLFIFCGHGNNGGDGLAIARLAIEEGRSVEVFILKSGKPSDDFTANKKRLLKLKRSCVHFITSEKEFPNLKDYLTKKEKYFKHTIIDALFGSGLNRPLQGVASELVNYLNQQSAHRVAVDIPSGLFPDRFSEGFCFHADHTISFQAPKLAFLFPENYESVGEFHIEDIGLHRGFIGKLPSKKFLVERKDVRERIKPRKKFDHKGKFGHAFIYAGSTGKMGAAILCSKACARTGAGLTTACVPQGQSLALNVAVPEIMTEEVATENFSLTDPEKFSAFAFGPGMGITGSSRGNFLSLLKKINKPSVFDADALTILSQEKEWWKLMPKNSILTPHMKEFERLAGKTSNWEQRHNAQVTLSQEHSLFIVLKGAYTCITTPDGNSFFNTTGNAGLAKGGSGDVLTGVIVSLLAQKYSPEDACIIGVYLHGLAADIAVRECSEYSLLATDIIDAIGVGYLKLITEERTFRSP